MVGSLYYRYMGQIRFILCLNEIELIHTRLPGDMGVIITTVLFSVLLWPAELLIKSN